MTTLYYSLIFNYEYFYTSTSFCMQEYHMNHSVYKFTYIGKGCIQESNESTPRVENTMDMKILNKQI